MDSNTHPYVIDADAEGSTRETAILLIGTATEAGLDPSVDVQRITRPSPGFRITEALATALGGDLDGDGEPDDLDGDQGDQESTGAPEPTPEAPSPADAPTGSDNAAVADAIEAETAEAPEPDSKPVEQVDYSAWEYQDLKSTVALRGIEVPNKQTETLIAALQADDAENPVVTETE